MILIHIDFHQLHNTIKPCHSRQGCTAIHGEDATSFENDIPVGTYGSQFMLEEKVVFAALAQNFFSHW